MDGTKKKVQYPFSLAFALRDRRRAHAPGKPQVCLKIRWGKVMVVIFVPSFSPLLYPSFLSLVFLNVGHRRLGQCIARVHKKSTHDHIVSKVVSALLPVSIYMCVVSLSRTRLHPNIVEKPRARLQSTAFEHGHAYSAKTPRRLRDVGFGRSPTGIPSRRHVRMTSPSFQYIPLRKRQGRSEDRDFPITDQHPSLRPLKEWEVLVWWVEANADVTCLRDGGTCFDLPRPSILPFRF